MKKILNITPRYTGYDKYPVDEDGKIILPRNDDGVILIYRRNTINYGNGLIGLLDGSKICVSDWEDLRRCFVIIDNDNTEHFYWSVGGSDSGVCMGVSSFNTPQGLYEDKKGIKKSEIDDNTDYIFEYGHRNEELIAQGFQTLTKMEVVKDNTVYFREDIGFMQANVDFFVRHPDGMFSVLEIKSTNNQNVKQLNEYKNGRVPMHYYTQAVLHYPIVLGDIFHIKGTYFAIGYNNSLNDIIICHYDRDKEQEELLLAAEKEFADYLKYDTVPKEVQILDTDKLISSIKGKYPVAADKSIKLSEKSTEAVRQCLELQKQISELKSKQKEIEGTIDMYKAIIMEEMADNALSEEFDIGGNKYYCSLKNSSRSTIKSTVLKNKYPDIYEECVSVSKFRTFAISEVKAKKK